MAVEGSISKELQESIRAATDPKVTFTVKCLLSFEVKPDKYKNRVLALSNCRCFIFTAKVPAKLEAAIHYLHIGGIESASPNQLRLTLKDGRVLYFSTINRDALGEVDLIITHIGSSLKVAFPSLPLEKLISKWAISPTSRMKVMHDTAADIQAKNIRPCDGFSYVYSFMCDYLGYAVIEEVIWDVDTIYLSQDSRSFCLQDFSHLASRFTLRRDHVPLLAALQYNTWFTHFSAADMKLTSDVLNEVLKVVKASVSLESLDLSCTGLKVDSVPKLAAALAANPSSKIVSLNLSSNALEDRGISSLSAAVAKLPRGLSRLDLSRSGMTAKGATKLSDSLVTNLLSVNTLRVLNLHGNVLKGDDLQSLYTFLSQPNNLHELDMTDGGAPLELLVAALASGCLNNLEVFRAAGNPYSAKRSKDPQSSWKHFFSNTRRLTTCCLADTCLPPPAVKALLLGLSINTSMTEVALPGVDLNISRNQLGSEGASIIATCAAVLKNVRSLDLSNNDLDSGLTEMLSSFVTNTTVRHLSIGQNFGSLKSKYLVEALDALVELMQNESSVLESLSIADSRLVLDTSRVINALGSNTTIKKVDLSGNQMGDVCAKMLAKALSINYSLESLSCDRNNLSATGLADIASAVQRNLSLRDLPLPLEDIAAAMKFDLDKVKSAVEMIQQSLQRNHGTQLVPRDSSYRLQQSLHSGAAQRAIDTRIDRLRGISNAIMQNSTHHGLSRQASVDDRVSQIEMAIKDATSARRAMTKLQRVAQKSEADSSPMLEKLDQLASQLQTALQSHVQSTHEEMLKIVQEDFPLVFSFHKNASQELLTGCEEFTCVEKQAVLMKEQLTTNMRNELSRVNLNATSYLFDGVIDRLLLALDDVSKSAQVQMKTSRERSEATLPPEKYTRREQPPSTEAKATGSSRSAGTADVPWSDNSSRRVLLNDRKRRPQTLQQEESAPKATDSSDRSHRGRSRRHQATVARHSSFDGPDVDLNTIAIASDTPQLTHVTKDRPKPARMHAAQHRPLATPADDSDLTLEARRLPGHPSAKAAVEQHCAHQPAWHALQPPAKNSHVDARQSNVDTSMHSHTAELHVDAAGDAGILMSSTTGKAKGLTDASLKRRASCGLDDVVSGDGIKLEAPASGEIAADSPKNSEPDSSTEKQASTEEFFPAASETKLSTSMHAEKGDGKQHTEDFSIGDVQEARSHVPKAHGHPQSAATPVSVASESVVHDGKTASLVERKERTPDSECADKTPKKSPAVAKDIRARFSCMPLSGNSLASELKARTPGFPTVTEVVRTRPSVSALDEEPCTSCTALSSPVPSDKDAAPIATSESANISMANGRASTVGVSNNAKGPASGGGSLATWSTSTSTPDKRAPPPKPMKPVVVPRPKLATDGANSVAGGFERMSSAGMLESSIPEGRCAADGAVNAGGIGPAARAENRTAAEGDGITPAVAASASLLPGSTASLRRGPVLTAPSHQRQPPGYVVAIADAVETPALTSAASVVIHVEGFNNRMEHEV